MLDTKVEAEVERAGEAEGECLCRAMQSRLRHTPLARAKRPGEDRLSGIRRNDLSGSMYVVIRRHFLVSRPDGMIIADDGDGVKGVIWIYGDNSIRELLPILQS